MELTKSAIKKNSEEISGLDGYNLIVSKIEKNVDINPDIAIEACKSLIEGLAKKSLELLSVDYNNKKSLRKDCDNKLPTLVRTAFEYIYKNTFEINLHNSLYSLIQNKNRVNSILSKSMNKMLKNINDSIKGISIFRDNRGDISHGRIYPKNEESEINLAKSIVSITDGICSFMVHEFSKQYILKTQEKGKLNFNELEEFNEWLDKKHNLLSIKIDFSKLLYENAYEKYEEFYYTEYTSSEDIEEETDSSISEEATLTDKAEKQTIEDLPAKVDKPSTQPSKIVGFFSFDPAIKEKKEPVQLVNTLDATTFWTNEANQKLKLFTESKNLKLEELKDLINNYLFTGKRPARDVVAKLMNDRPSLPARRIIIEPLIDRIIKFAKGL